MKQRRIVCAANRNLATGEMVIGPRHFDPVMHSQITARVRLAERLHEDGGDTARREWRSSEQGFIDNFGQFMDRKEAFQVAKAAGQILYGPHLPNEELDSSDLY